MSWGWFANAAAVDVYYVTRAGAEAWAGVVTITAAQKEALHTTAYNRILYSKLFNLPAAPTAAELLVLQMAQAEYAWHLYYHITPGDRRKGIQAQGVIKAGVVKEDYYAEMLQEQDFPATVMDILDGWADADGYFGSADITREDDEEILE